MYFGTLIIINMLSNSWFVIANPKAGNKNFSASWKKIVDNLNLNKIDFSFSFTQYSKHEIELVQNAIQKGYRNIISVGGDGTLHHVVNGIMLQRYVKSSEITISVIPLGTGNDWIKTYNIPKNIEKAIALICLKNTVLQDIGQLTLTDSTTHYFNNVAGLGYDGYIVNKLQKLKRFGPIAYLLSGLSGLLLYKKTNFIIEFNNQKIETTCLMTLFGICQYSGGGMQFTKDVNTTDGLLDITIAKNLTLFDLIFNIKKLYNGAIVHHKKVATYKTTIIKVTPENTFTFIQADGELIGQGAVDVTIIKKAINFITNKIKS